MSEQYFHNNGIGLILANHRSPQGIWWGQAEKTDDGVTIKVQAYADTTDLLIQELYSKWMEKMQVVPSFIKALPVYAEFKDVTPLDDEIPF